MADTTYDYGTYSSYSQDPEFKRLQSQFAGAFGGSFPTFSYEAFINDPAYAQRIYAQIGGAGGPAKQQSLQEILDYFKAKTEGSAFDQSGGTIDVKSLFSPLKAGVTQYADQARRAGKADISRLYAGSEQRASEALAGTGLGRSGAAAGGFAAIQNQRQGAVDKLLARINDYEMKAQMELDAKIADAQFGEELRKRGANLDQINSLTAFNRSLYTMQYDQLLQESANAQKDFWDTWGQLIGAGISAGGQIAAAAA